MKMHKKPLVITRAHFVIDQSADLLISQSCTSILTLFLHFTILKMGCYGNINVSQLLPRKKARSFTATIFWLQFCHYISDEYLRGLGCDMNGFNVIRPGASPALSLQVLLLS